MDLITRDEFDVQCKVLARTREKLDHLQQQIDELLQNQELIKKNSRIGLLSFRTTLTR